MAAKLCDNCHQRPAVATVRRTKPDGTTTTEQWCEVCLAEHGLARPGTRGGPGGLGLFDDFFSDFFERGFGGAPGGSTGTAPGPRVEQTDVTEYFSDATRELL